MLYSNKDYNLKIKLIVAIKNAEFGPGLISLLKNIKKTKSIKNSAKALGLSYSKALKLLNNLESNLNIQLVEKNRGGSLGGETKLTNLGEKFIESYESLEKLIDEDMEQKFKKCFYWLENI